MQRGLLFLGVVFVVLGFCSAFPLAEQGTHPEDGAYTASASLSFELTCTNDVGISVVELWGDWDSGWHKVASNSSFVNDTVWSEEVSGLENGDYRWGVYCKSSNGTGSWSENRTLIIGTGDSTDAGEVDYWVYAFSATPQQLEQGYEREMLAKRRIIFLHNGTYYSVGLASVGNTTATVFSLATEESRELAVGEAALFDVDSDSWYDISFSLGELSPPYATLRLTSIHEEVLMDVSEEGNVTIGNETNSTAFLNATVNTTTTEENATTTSGNSFSAAQEDSQKGLLWTWIIICVCSVLIIGVGIYFFTRKKGDGEASVNTVQ